MRSVENRFSPACSHPIVEAVSPHTACGEPLLSKQAPRARRREKPCATRNDRTIVSSRRDLAWLTRNKNRDQLTIRATSYLKKTNDLSLGTSH